MNRRHLLGSISAGLLAGGAPGGFYAARAQRQNLPEIGILDFVSGRDTAEVGYGMKEAGFEPGRDFKIERSRAEYRADQLARNATELVKRQVSLIIVLSNRAALAAQS